MVTNCTNGTIWGFLRQKIDIMHTCFSELLALVAIHKFEVI